MEEKWKTKIQRIPKPEIANDVNWVCLDISKARTELKYEPKLTFKQWLSKKL